MMSGSRRRLTLLAAAGAMTLCMAVGLLGSAGCGEKIAIPESSGLFGVAPYHLTLSIEAPGAVDIVAVGNLLAVIDDMGTLTMYDTELSDFAEATGLMEPTSICTDPQDQRLFVWEQGAQRMSVFDTGNLSVVASAELTGIRSVSGMATTTAWVDELVPGALTFLYVADPDSNVVHRYAYYASGDFVDYGLLTRGSLTSGSTRDIHAAGSLCRDYEDSLLVCDVDTMRNWVIRFGSHPNPTDTDELERALPALFTAPVCPEPRAAEYVLGNANSACDGSNWVPGPSAEDGEFDRPLDVDIDGAGRIYVVDSDNVRVQQFEPTGEYLLSFARSNLMPAEGSSDPIPVMTDIAVMDKVQGTGSANINYGAWVFVLAPGLDTIYRFTSDEQYQDDGAPPLEY